MAQARAVAKAEAAEKVQQCADDTATQAIEAQNDLAAIKAAGAGDPKAGIRPPAAGTDATAPLLSQTDLSDDINSAGPRLPIRQALRQAYSQALYTNHVIPYEDQRPALAALIVLVVSIALCSLSVMQENAGIGAEANSEEQPDAPPINPANTMWMILCSGMVMIMTPGISLYYGGMLADEKMLNRMVRTFVNLGLVTVQWITVGYSLSFAPSNKYAFNLVGDFSYVAMRGVGASPAGSPIDPAYGIPHGTFMLFQLMFAAIATTILSGSIAHLMSFRAFCIFLVAWTTFVYDPVCHAVWGGGILNHHIDYAGGTVVHLLSGVSAATAATLLNNLAKRGSTTKDAWDIEMHSSWDRSLGGGTVAHNVTYVIIGVVFLWFGWFGFNGGPALSPNAVASTALVNTNVAAGFGMITWMLFETLSGGNPSAIGAATGSVCGLVGITPCAGYVTGLVSGPVGMLSAGASFTWVWLDEHTTLFHRISSPHDVMATHGIAGLVGTLLTGLFAYRPVNTQEAKLDRDGVLYSGDWSLFQEDCIAVLAVTLYAICVTCLIVWVQLKVLGNDRLLAARYLLKQKGEEHLYEERFLNGNQRDNSPIIRHMMCNKPSLDDNHKKNLFA